MLLLTLLTLFACGGAPASGPDSSSSEDEGLNDSAPSAGDSAATDTTTTDTTADTSSDSGTTRDSGPPAEGLLGLSGPRPKNLLVISLDTTRRDWFERFGGPAPTPNIDALFDAGVLLEDHRSCSNWTWTSMVCVQASQQEHALGWLAVGAETLEGPPPEVVMGDDVLQGLGWRTLLVSSNPLLSVAAGTAYGFDEAHDVTGPDADSVNEVAYGLLETLADSGAGPSWYLHLHYMQPHAPYDPPEAYLEGLEGLEAIGYDLDDAESFEAMTREYPLLSADERALILEHLHVRYTGELRYADDTIGALVDRAESLGLLEDTLIVFLTDHGEQLGEHGSLGHDDDLYDEENRSVAAFVAPGLAPAVWEGPTIHQDIWPTILHLLDVTPVEDFSGIIVGDRVGDEPRFAQRYKDTNTVQTVERSGLKLIYRWDGARELYRVSSDAAEQKDLYDPEDPEVQALWALLMPEVNAIDALAPVSPIDPGP